MDALELAKPWLQNKTGKSSLKWLALVLLVCVAVAGAAIYLGVTARRADLTGQNHRNPFRTISKPGRAEFVPCLHLAWTEGLGRGIEDFREDRRKYSPAWHSTHYRGRRIPIRRGHSGLTAHPDASSSSLPQRLAAQYSAERTERRRR